MFHNSRVLQSTYVCDAQNVHFYFFNILFVQDTENDNIYNK